MQGSCPDSPPFPPASRTGVAVFSSHGASGPSKKQPLPQSSRSRLSNLNIEPVPSRFRFSSRLSTGHSSSGVGVLHQIDSVQHPTLHRLPQHPIAASGAAEPLFLGPGIWNLGPSLPLPHPRFPVRNGGFSGRDSSLKTGQADGLLSLEGLVFCSLEIYSQPLNTYPPPIQSGPRTAARGGRRRGRERSGIGPGSGSC